MFSLVWEIELSSPPKGARSPRRVTLANLSGVLSAMDALPVSSAELPHHEWDVEKCSAMTQPLESYLLSLWACFYIFKASLPGPLWFYKVVLMFPWHNCPDVGSLLIWEPSR